MVEDAFLQAIIILSLVQSALILTSISLSSMKSPRVLLWHFIHLPSFKVDADIDVAGPLGKYVLETGIQIFQSDYASPSLCSVLT